MVLSCVEFVNCIAFIFLLINLMFIDLSQIFLLLTLNLSFHYIIYSVF